MDDQLKSTLHISDECGRRIVSSYKVYRNIAVLYVLYSAWSFAKTYFRLDNDIDREFHSPAVILSAKVYPIIYLLQLIVGIIHYFLYNKAFLMQKQAVELSDEQLFTDSYQYFKKGNYCSLAIVAGLILYELIFLYFDIWRY